MSAVLLLLLLENDDDEAAAADPAGTMTLKTHSSKCS